MAENTGILGALIGSLSTAVEYPKTTIFIFVVVWSLSFAIFAGGYSRQAYANMWRLIMAVVTAPFRFLRDIVQMLLRYDSDEKRYSGTKEYLLYKTCQLNYLLIFLLALFVLAGGVETAFLTLIPQDLLEERTYVSARLNEAQTELAAASKLLTALEAPTARAAAVEAQTLASTKADTSSAKVKQQSERLREAFNTALEFAAAPTRQVRDYLDTTVKCGSDDVRNGFIQQLDDFLRNQAVSADAQTHIRRYATAHFELCDLRELQNETQLALETARLGVVRFDDRLKAAQDEQKRLDSQTSELGTRIRELSFPRLVLETFDGDRLVAALTALLFTLLIVVIVVWAGGISIDVLTWITMMMVALERYAAPVDSSEPDHPSSDDVTSLGRL